jgi:hypothetical protein
MGVFSGGEWWVEGHIDHSNATQALHCLRLQQLCGELKKSKAVFTPHLPGTRSTPPHTRMKEPTTPPEPDETKIEIDDNDRGSADPGGGGARGAVVASRHGRGFGGPATGWVGG